MWFWTNSSTLQPFNPVTLLPCDLVTLLPYYPVILLHCYPVTLSCYPVTLSCPVTLFPCYFSSSCGGPVAFAHRFPLMYLKENTHAEGSLHR